ncbi:MAG: hypothetical protein NC548_25675 [Lachnospiraceae bacterium]|nr:hypothetical protein [Lachnospiraceae bacterium]
MSLEITDLIDLDIDTIKSIVAEGGEYILDLVGHDKEGISAIVGDSTKLLTLFENSYGKELDIMTTSSMRFEDLLR